MIQSFFVTGTDTDVGKTLVACALLEAANQRGLVTAAIKPVAAGCELTPEGLRNSDALQLQQAMSQSLTYEQVNPVALLPAIAPHIAAQVNMQTLQAEPLAAACRELMVAPAEFFLIEGAGGWRVPLNRNETLADVAIALQVPVILVVGMKLGCINHALLTVEAIRRDGLVLAGWVANRIDAQMAVYQENLASLVGLIDAPCLGVIPSLSEPSARLAASYLDLSLLLFKGE